MHHGNDFWEDFEGFWGPKRSHVGNQRGGKMHLNLKASKIKNTDKNKWNLNVCLVYVGPRWE